VVFVTVDTKGMPNAIYATCVKMISSEKIVIADNFFSKTKNNLAGGCMGAVLFITKDRKSFQIKGATEYHASGAIYDDMKKWLDPKYPGHAAAVVNVNEAFSGAEKLL